jgi:DNA-binding NtrC family response regulator
MPLSENKACIVVIDDEIEMLENCRRIFSLWGHSVITLQDGSDIGTVFQQSPPDLVFTDLKMPGRDGISLLEEILRIAPDVPVVIVTGYATVESAVEAIKKGAFDYITKPFTLDLLKVVTERALEKRRLTQEIKTLRSQVFEGGRFGKLVGSSQPMREIFSMIQRVAPLDANVVITGESGTGKELVARAIHAHSHRSQNRFVPIDCASLPEALLESELFGHQRGSFTGAIAEKAGLLEYANQGTLFLDEVSELTPSIQSKLLRALQERVFRRIGGNEMIETDIRLIAATNADLAKRVEENAFREDLYYRLNVINIQLPPLRDRRDDIPLLVWHFIERFGGTRIPRISGITPEAMIMLQSHHWPGNIRELQNAIERAVALAEGEYLEARDFPERMLQAAPGKVEKGGDVNDLLAIRKQVLQGFERNHIIRLLKENGGNVSVAARQAGINRRTLYRLMRRYGIDLETIRQS